MEPRTTALLALFTEGRTRFTKVLDTLTEADLPKKLTPSPNSAGLPAPWPRAMIPASGRTSLR